jgi:uncharacterized protein DUF4384
MLSAVLLSALILGTPPAAMAAPASQDDPAIRIWLSNDGRYGRGDQAKVQVKTRDDGYLLVLNVDPDGRVRVLFPLDPQDDDFVSGGKKYQIVGRGGREGFNVSNRSGQGTVYAAVSRAPFRFEGYVAGDHWDFSALDDLKISDKPETDLNEFVRRIAGADFDYDVLGYDIFEHVYGEPNAVAYDTYYDDSYGYSGWGYGGTSLFIGLGFGHRFYDPFFYSPFYYSPFFYSPFYYPAFYYPYGFQAHYYPARFYYPHHYYPYGYYPYAYYPGRPYYGGYFATPWRNRMNDPLAQGGFQYWRGREATFGTSATLAAYRGGFNRMPWTPGRAPTATPVRGTVATTDAGTTRRRSLDMTPSRTEADRSRGVLRPTETASAPVARRAVDRSADRRESWGGRVPDQGGSRRSNSQVAERGQVGRAPEARPSRPTSVTRDRVEGPRSAAPSGYEGARVIESRPEARRADDDRPASRPNIESRRMDESAPPRMERGAPAPQVERSEPRMERSAPAPRREESRSAEPRAQRGDGGGRSGGRESGGGGGGGGGGSRGGGWRR